MYTISWVNGAISRYENYIKWYLQQGGIIVARDFEQHITSCINLIAHSPYQARKVEEKPKLREYVVQKYPFLISYTIKDANNIIITSILHQRQNY